MNQLPVHFLDRGLHRVLFDAMPMPVLVVDAEVCVLEYNAAAAQLLTGKKAAILGTRCGQALHCAHAEEASGGCGFAPACAECVIRQSVRAAAQGEHVTRRWASVDLLSQHKRPIKLRISAHPFEYERQSLVLLILEGLND